MWKPCRILQVGLFLLAQLCDGADRGVTCNRCIYSYQLGGCPFNGPLSGTKYPTRAASPIQNASTPKSSLPFSKHRRLGAVVRCCAQVLVEHCTEFRTSFISN